MFQDLWNFQIKLLIYRENAEKTLGMGAPEKYQPHKHLI